MNRRGFTLIETLVVIALSGIIGTAGFLSFNHVFAVNRVRDAALGLRADLEAARGAARRFNTDSVLSFDPANPAAYALTTNGQRRTRSMPSGTTVTALGATAPATVRFTAPYGELDEDRAFRIALEGRSDVAPITVSVVGVTGKVIVRAAQ